MKVLPLSAIKWQLNLNVSFEEDTQAIAGAITKSAVRKIILGVSRLLYLHNSVWYIHRTEIAILVDTIIGKLSIKVENSFDYKILHLFTSRHLLPVPE